MLLNQKRVQDIFRKYSLRYPETIVFHNYEELLDKKISFPCVLKVDSQQVMHKTELGLVFTHIDSMGELKQKVITAETILKENKVTEYNLILQESIKGAEFIAGLKTDPTFGKVLVFGLGGIFVELVKDVSMMVAPLGKKEILEMIESTKAKKFIEGYRGFPKANKDKIVDLLSKLSKIAVTEKNFIEIDFNPVIVNEKEAYIVDARIISDENA
jgi:hypothetical protein